MSTRAKSASNIHQSAPEKTSRAVMANIEFVNRQRKYVLARREILNLGQRVLERIKLPDSTATLTFIRDPEMQALNRDYRRIDRPTDVLAFAYQESLSDNDPNQDPNYLGDVIISVETAARYAAEQKISFETEINWLVIHGLLHLAGYDHEIDQGEMRRLERRLRKEFLGRNPQAETNDF